MPTTDTMTGTTGTHEPASLDPVRDLRTTPRQSFPTAMTRPGKEADDKQQICIAVTDRGARQRDDVELLLDNEGVALKWINAENVRDVWLSIDRDEIHGLLLTAWATQKSEIARDLDRRFLLQNIGAFRPVPLLAIGGGMLKLFTTNGGGTSNPPRASQEEENRLVQLIPDRLLHQWAGVDTMSVPNDPLPNPILPPHGTVVVNATSHDERVIEGIEIRRRGTIQVGTRFDLVKLALRAPSEDTRRAAENIIKNFVAVVRTRSES